MSKIIKACFTHRDLGYVVGGVSCDLLKFWTNDTDLDLLDILSVLPVDVRPGLVSTLLFTRPIDVWKLILA